MRRWWLSLVLLVAPLPLWAQSGTTLVTAQVTDVNGNLYSNCQWSVVFVGQNATPGAGPYAPAPLLNGQQGTCDSQGFIGGSTGISLADNINTVTPTPSQWQFSVCSASGYLGGPYCFSTLLTITGTTQNISAQLQKVAPILPASSPQSGNTYLQLQSILPLLTEFGSGSTSQAQKCALAGACKVVYWGDSITEGVYGLANEDSWAFQINRMLTHVLNNVTVTGIDLGLASTSSGNAIDPNFKCGTSFNRAGNGNGYLTWPNACVNGESWEGHISDQAPDIVFVAFGQNDTATGIGPYETNLAGIVTFLNGLTKAPTIVLVATFPNSVANGAAFGNQQTLLGIGQATREFARNNGLVLIDAGRLFTLDRDGYDPALAHFNYETGWLNYPSGWVLLSGASMFVGTGVPTLSSGTMTIPTGGAMIQRQRLGTDYIINATFASLTSSSVPSIFYRMNAQGTPSTGGGNSYKVQASYSAGAWNLTWYLDTRPSGGSVATLAGPSACSASGSSTLQLFVRAIGSTLQAYCNASNTATINGTDYNDPGGEGPYGSYSAIGIQTTGGTVTETTYIGNTLTIAGALPVSEVNLLGVYNASDLANGTYLTNPFSFGGNGINHPSILGGTDYYAAAALPVILALRNDLVQHSVVSATSYNTDANHSWTSGSGAPSSGLCTTSTAGSLYSRTDSVTGTTSSFYVCANNAGSASWVAK